jgi:(1->4)-alpha-D-glucan 1-alpha-D-glucosylmutase
MDGARQTLSEGDWPVLDCLAAGWAAAVAANPAGRARKSSSTPACASSN